MDVQPLGQERKSSASPPVTLSSQARPPACSSIRLPRTRRAQRHPSHQPLQGYPPKPASAPEPGASLGRSHRTNLISTKPCQRAPLRLRSNGTLTGLWNGVRTRCLRSRASLPAPTRNPLCALRLLPQKERADPSPFHLIWLCAFSPHCRHPAQRTVLGATCPWQRRLHRSELSWNG